MARATPSSLGGYNIANGGAAKTISIKGSANVNITGPVVDNTTGGAASNFTYNGTGALVLSGANTYTGTTTATTGTLQFAKEVSLYNNNTASWVQTNINVASGATFAMNVGGTGEFTAGDVSTLLSQVGGTSSRGFLNGAIVGFDTTNAAGGNFTYGNAINNTNSGANALGVTKFGTNTLTLSAANGYTGPTTVVAGTLAVSGSLAAASTVNVNGGTLNITGKVGGPVNVAAGATLSGNGNGTTTGDVGGALTLAAGAVINTQDNTVGTLGGSTLALTAGATNAVLDLDVSSGTTADLLTFSGAASLNDKFTINVDALSGATAGNTYTIVSATGGLTLNDFVAGILTGALAGDTMTIGGGGTSITLTINAPSGKLELLLHGNQQQLVHRRGQLLHAGQRRHAAERLVELDERCLPQCDDVGEYPRHAEYRQHGQLADHAHQWLATGWLRHADAAGHGRRHRYRRPG